eukprot:6918137-Pyramimonas_sp.AAC.1
MARISVETSNEELMNAATKLMGYYMTVDADSDGSAVQEYKPARCAKRLRFFGAKNFTPDLLEYSPHSSAGHNP